MMQAFHDHRDRSRYDSRHDPQSALRMTPTGDGAREVMWQGMAGLFPSDMIEALLARMEGGR